MIDQPEDIKEKTPPTEKDAKKPHVVNKTKAALKHLPEKKQYFELVTAVLSVPLMITVLLLNLGNLRNTDPPVTPTPTLVVTPTMTSPTVTSPTKSTTTPAPTAVIPTINLSPGTCTKEVGPVEITSPAENETITNDPICIDISRRNNNYCEVVWSYRINTDPWSEYTDKSICLYNLSSGQKNVEVRVKSIASTDQIVLKRSFMVLKDTPSPTSTSSGTVGN